MAITPEQSRFVREIVRPLAEQMRGILLSIAAIQPDVQRLLPVGEDPTLLINDRVTDDGVALLTVADVLALAQLSGTVLAIATAENQALIARACVRPPRVLVGA